jgi:hypothetical protein
MYLFCNSRIHVITLYSGHVCVYYTSMLRCWHLVWILVRTNHPCLEVGCHTSRGKHAANPHSRRANCQCFCTAKNRVVKITCSGSKTILRTTKHTMIYSGSGPSSEVIVICLAVWYWKWKEVTMGWAENSRSLHGEGKNDLVPPAWRVRGLS